MMSAPQKIPPRFLPTLTEVVSPPVTMQLPVPADTSRHHEQIVDRVMQRLDVSLESRLHEALGTLVLEQLQALEPRLRQEIESIVRQTVAEAVAVELDAAKPA